MKLRRFLSLVLVSLLTVAATNALASNFVLTFNGLQNREEVLNYYDGGTGSLGSGPGTNYGITFTPSFIAVAVTGFENPDVGALNGSSATMNVPGGFTNVFSFYYEDFDGSGSVTLWSGLNGTGVELADIPLSAESSWDPVAAFLSGANAKSVVFSGTSVEFGEITDSSSPVLPEPSSLLLVGTGVAGLVAWLRRHVVS